MSFVGYLIAGWTITFIVFAIYIYLILKKGRDLTSKVPESKRRWIDS